jgi:formylglycine-generating enzyme required for sulfatase activity
MTKSGCTRQAGANIMRAIVILLVVSLAGFGVAQDKKFPDPTPRKAEILKLFAEEFVSITPGTGKFPASFTMGSDQADDEKPPHQVTFKHSFAIARYEVTQELYHVVMGQNPAKWRGPRNAVEMVSWDEASAFCQKVTVELRRSKLLGEDEVIRLPSEAEWEYACRAGTTTRYSFGDRALDLPEHGWFKGNSKGEDPPVGKKKPNAWGLYDVHGYIWEWCQDAWHPDYKDAPTDGRAREASGAKERVLRGGSWADSADACRSAFRQPKETGHRSDTIGFRCVRSRK